MERRSLKALACGLALSALAAQALAQSKTTSGLTGSVSDESGARLQQVMISITGETLIGGPRTAQSDAAGRYRFGELNPGTYSVTAALHGFRTVRQEQVRLLLGQTTEVNFTLPVEEVEETLVVTGEAPDIDPLSSATTTNLSNEYLQNLPTTRFEPEVLNLAPGINLNAAYGGGEDSANAYQIDGVDTSDPEGGTPYTFVNFNIIQEVQLVGLGAPAEYGGFTGVVFNSVTKTGGNSTTGLAEALYSGKSLTASNSDIPNINPTTEKFYDTTAQVGGPIRKDQLWYFASAQYLAEDSTDGGPLRTERDPRYFGKLSWQAGNSSTLDAWVEYDRFDVTGRGGDAATPLEATVNEKAPETVWNLAWRSVLSPNTLLSVAAAGWAGYYYLDPRNGYDTAGHFDALTQTSSKNSTYFFLADRDRAQLNASLSHHAGDFIHGDHDFKFGMEIERSTVRNRYGYPTGAWFYDNYAVADDPGTEAYDPVYYSIGYYGNDYDVHARNERVSVYAQDTWRVGPRVTINPGVRADFNRGNVGSGRVFDTNPVAPRIGIAWDVNGDGKTLLKAHYGRYYEALFATYYYWVDPGAFHGGELRTVFPSGDSELISETAGARYDIRDNLKHPYLDQYILGLDREIYPGITLSGTLVYRKNKDFIETVSRDGVFVPVTGTIPDTGQTVTLYDYLNPGEDTLIVANVPQLERTYKGVILTLNRRLRNNWQLFASYVYSQARGNTDNISFGSGGGNGGPGSFLDTPNSLVNAEGKLTHDQTQQIKVQGSYLFPALNLSLSGNYTYYSGDTWTRRTTCLLTDDGEGGLACHDFPQGTVRYFAEPRGSRRLPAASEIDLRAEWSHPFGAGELGLFVDAFNVTNQGRATSVQDRDGSTFGQPLSYNSPRNYRLGLRYRW